MSYRSLHARLDKLEQVRHVTAGAAPMAFWGLVDGSLTWDQLSPWEQEWVSDRLAHLPPEGEELPDLVEQEIARVRNPTTEENMP